LKTANLLQNNSNYLKDMNAKRFSIVFIIFVGLAVVDRNTGMAQTKKDELQIRSILDSTAKGWNNGNLALYLSAYTPDATEMLSTGPAGGVEVIEQTMKSGFWKNGRPLQNLKYDNLVVRFTDKNSALVTGRCNLSGAGKPDRGGWFTTVWIRTQDGWRIIHDHS